MIYDVTHNKIVGDDTHCHGMIAFISWHRLVEELRTSGEISAQEEPLYLKIDDQGIRYVIGDRKS